MGNHRRSGWACGLGVVLALAWSPTALSASGVRGVVVLMPGTANSAAPGSVHWDRMRRILEVTPYFSREVIQAYESAGYAVHVVRDLRPFAQLEENGASALAEVEAWYFKTFPSADQPLYFVAHSAGGFYALHAASLNSRLPLRGIQAVATPFCGVEVADAVLESGWAGRAVQALLQSTEGFFDLRGLPALTSAAVRSFLQGLRLPRDLPVAAYGGAQRLPLHVFEAWDSSVVSPFLVPTGQWIGRANDGIVSLDSALCRAARLSGRDGAPVQLRLVTQPQLNMDHVKQVLDYRLMKVLGIRAADSIRTEQARFYSILAGQLAELTP